jgi:hypothetical protein
MNRGISRIWSRVPFEATAQFVGCLDRAADRDGTGKPVSVFFRADDVAVYGKSFDRLMEIFLRHRTPLCLAVVPAWLTKERAEMLKRYHRKAPNLWCWHQHGWRHVNHQTSGKKAEFGDSRAADELRRDIHAGGCRLETLMGKDFYPVFTPPWNRCGTETLKILKLLGYHAVSRGRQRASRGMAGLPEFSVDVDLHTRKEPCAEEGWKNLFTDLEHALSQEVSGIMIHHQRMNDEAFDFLEFMLTVMKSKKHITMINFQDVNIPVV